MRSSDCSSDVCPSDLEPASFHQPHGRLSLPCGWLHYAGRVNSGVRCPCHSFGASFVVRTSPAHCLAKKSLLASTPRASSRLTLQKIGRASCREKSVSVLVDLGGRRIIKKKKKKKQKES